MADRDGGAEDKPSPPRGPGADPPSGVPPEPPFGPTAPAPSDEDVAKPLRKRRLPTQSQIFFIAILAIVLFLTWKVFQPFVIYMVTGVFVAALALPIDRFWERTWGRLLGKKKGNTVAAFFTILSVFLIITVPLVGLGFVLIGDVESAVEAIQSGQVERSLNDLLDAWPPTADQNETERNATIDGIWDWAQPRIRTALETVLAAAVGFVGRLAIAVTVILFVTYYVLTDGHKLVAYLRRAAPLPDWQVDRMVAEGHNGLKAVFFGQILTSLIQGGLGGIGFLIAGVPGAIIWAAVMAILSLLPVVGAFIVWIPAAIFLFVSGDLWQGIFLVAWGILIVGQVDNFIRPKLIGSRAEIHPLFVLVGVLGGVAAWGFIGLFLGPLLVGMTVSILKIWETDYLDPDLAGESSWPEHPVAGRAEATAGKATERGGDGPS